MNAGFVSLGRGDFIVAVARDISDRKRVEEQLRRSEERFRSLIQYSSDIITILNPDGTIRYESPAFYRLFGYREEKILAEARSSSFILTIWTVRCRSFARNFTFQDLRSRSYLSSAKQMEDISPSKSLGTISSTTPISKESSSIVAT